MSKLATTDPEELRPLLHERIDQCNPEGTGSSAQDLADARSPALGR